MFLDPTGDLIAARGNLVPDPPEPEGPLLPRDDVVAAAAALLVARGLADAPPLVDEPELVVVARPGERPRVAYRIAAFGSDGPAEVIVDASTGKPIDARSTAMRHDVRETRWADHVVLTSPPPPDYQLIHASAPYFFSGSWPGTTLQTMYATHYTRVYYDTRHGRDGWDDNPSSTTHRMRIVADVWPSGGTQWWPENAWLGQMMHSVMTGSDQACTDIIGHEFTHGVQEVDIGWGSGYQQLALGEGLSDIFGELIERHSVGGPDWVMGTGACAPIRSLVDPEGCTGCASLGPAHLSNLGGFAGSFHADGQVVGKAGFLVGRPSSAGSVSFAGLPVTGIGNDADTLLYDIENFWLLPTDDYFDFAWVWRYAAFWRWGEYDVRYQRARDAIDAVGMWTGPYTEPLFTHNQVALTTLAIGGSSYTAAVFRTNTGTNELLQRRRLGTLGSGNAWSTPTHIHWAGGNPSIATSGGVSHLVFRYDLNSSIVHYRSNTTGGWDPVSVVPSSSVDPWDDVSAVFFGGQLYVFYRSVATSALRYVRWNGTSWTAPSTVPGASLSSGGPAAAAYGGRIYVFYRGGTGAANLRYVWSSTGTSWTGPVAPDQGGAPSLAGTPTAHVAQQRLHVAGRTSTGAIRYSSLCSTTAGCTYRPGQWTRVTEVEGGLAGTQITLYSDFQSGGIGTRLYALRTYGTGTTWVSKRSE